MENRVCAGFGDSKNEEIKKTCLCPYCDNPVPMSYPFCQVCQVELKFCKECKKPVGKEDKVCPNCGKEIK